MLRGLSPPLPPFEVELSSDEVVVLSQPGVVHSPSPDVGHERPLRVTPAPRFEGRESSGDTEDAAGEGPEPLSPEVRLESKLDERARIKARETHSETCSPGSRAPHFS